MKRTARRRSMSSTEKGSGNAECRRGCRSIKPRPPCRYSIAIDTNSTFYWSVDKWVHRASWRVSINGALTSFYAKRVMAATEHPFLRYFGSSVIKTLDAKTRHALD